MEKWEYKFEIRDYNCYGYKDGNMFSYFENYCNELGLQGWELVSMQISPREVGSCTIIFKRKIEQG